MNKKERNEESKKNKEFFEAVKLLSKDTGVTVDAMCESIQNVLIGALKKEYNNKDIVFCDVDADKGEFRVYLRKTVVSEISDPDTDLLVEQAQQYKKGAMPGDIVEIPVETAKVSRITAERANICFARLSARQSRVSFAASLRATIRRLSPSPSSALSPSRAMRSSASARPKPCSTRASSFPTRCFSPMILSKSMSPAFAAPTRTPAQLFRELIPVLSEDCLKRKFPRYSTAPLR